MSSYDLVIRNGAVVTAADTFTAEVGISGGRIAAIGESLDGDRVIDATGRLVLPGGVDSHCQIEQLEADGSVHEETFESATRSAFAGGTTTLIRFSPQFKGEPIGVTQAITGSAPRGLRSTAPCTDYNRPDGRCTRSRGV